MPDHRICLYDDAALAALGGAPVVIDDVRGSLNAAKRALLDAAGALLAASTAALHAAVRADHPACGRLLLAYLPTVADGAAPEVTYSYSASFAVLLSGRRIVRVERIWADGKLLRGSAGDLKVELGALRVHNGDADQAVDPLVASAEGADASAWRGSAYVVFEALQLADYGNRIQTLSFEVVADDGPVAVGSMIAELAGVTAEAGPSETGFAATGGSVRAVAETVQPAFPMICRDKDGAHVRFASVAGGAVAALDLGASATAARVAKVARDIALLDTTAAALTVAYLDPARDYQAGLQRARREGPVLRDERVDLPATLDAAAAHAVATGALARRGIERRRAAVSLP
jgi:hypothetical protein